MADNVTLPGTGAVVGSDDVGGVQYQQVKLVDGTLDSSTPIGTSSNPLKTAGPDNVSLRSVTLTTTGADTSIDCTGYGAVQYQMSGAWTGVAVFEASNDNSNWFPQYCVEGESSLLIDNISAAGIYQVAPIGRYLRINVKQISGSMVVLALGRAQPTVFARDSLALAMDRSNNTPMNVAVGNVLQDQRNALILSDGAGPYTKTFASTGDVQIIDTLGYASAAIYINAVSANVTITAANDLGATSFLSVVGYYSTSSSGTVVAGITNINFTTAGPFNGMVNCTYRYLKIQMNAIGTGPAFSTVYLRQSPVGSLWNLIGTQTVSSGAGDAGSINNASAIGTVQAQGYVRNAFATGSAGSVYRLVQNSNLALIVEKHAVPELTTGGSATITNSTAAQTLVAAATGQRGYLSSLQIMAEALGTASELTIAGTLVAWKVKLTTAGVPGGMNYTFDPPLRGSATNTAITIAMGTASATGNVYVNGQGFYGN